MDNFSSEKDKAQAMAIANLSKTIPTAALSQPTVSEVEIHQAAIHKGYGSQHAGLHTAFEEGARWMLERLKGVVG